MSAAPGDQIVFQIVTRHPETMLATDADALPTGTLVRNGLDTSVVVIVEHVATPGIYKITTTIPTTWSNGDEVQIRAAALVDGQSDTDMVWADTLDGPVSSAVVSIFDPTSNVYGTIEEGDAYFATRLNSYAWDESTDSNKLKALAMATRLIDRLNFVGQKADPKQTLEFPRGTDTTIPESIKIACYEISIMLLDDYDVEHEQDLLTQDMSTFSTIRTRHDRSFIPQHKLHGIPSSVAWSYLLPYLRDSRRVRFDRVS